MKKTSVILMWKSEKFNLRDCPPFTTNLTVFTSYNTADDEKNNIAYVKISIQIYIYNHTTLICIYCTNDTTTTKIRGYLKNYTLLHSADRCLHVLNMCVIHIQRKRDICASESWRVQKCLFLNFVYKCIHFSWRRHSLCI